MIFINSEKRVEVRGKNLNEIANERYDNYEDFLTSIFEFEDYLIISKTRTRCGYMFFLQRRFPLNYPDSYAMAYVSFDEISNIKILISLKERGALPGSSYCLARQITKKIQKYESKEV
jgi:hypothetical protein